MSDKKKTAGLKSIAIERIYVSETDAQVARRKRFDKAALAELTESVKSYGVLQPIIVRDRPTAGGYLYELVAGERRMLAAEAAGLEEIAAVVRELTDEQIIEVQLIENLQRADVHPMEEAEGYQQLMKVHGQPIEELHTRVGKSRSYVYGRLKLLALCKKAREAFYSGEISASVALLIARIPSEKLQLGALEGITDEHDRMSYREASEWVQREFMLRLKDAPFPTDDPKLNGKAGPCSSCPKRTGNQPELFGDVQSADVCTDPGCFHEKTIAYGNRALAEAKERGQQTITGNQAKQIAPRGAEGSMKGYCRLDSTDWSTGKKIARIVGKDAEVVLLQDPESGAVVEVVSEAAVKAALKAAGKSTARAINPQSAAEKKVKIERQFRMELYARIRPSLPAPRAQDVAAAMFRRLWHDATKLLCKVRGFEPPEVKQSYGRKTKDYNAVAKGVETWTEEAASALINDMIYVSELMVGSYSNDKPERLLEAAKSVGVDAAALRRELAPKPKAAKKKPGRKKAA